MAVLFNFTEFPALSMQIAAFLPTAIILPLGLVGNITALVGLIFYLRTRTNNLVYYFIGSLILYDLALLVLYWPIELIRKSIDWPFGSFLCYVFNIFPLFCNSGPSFIMIAMMVDRYRVLVNKANPNPSLSRKMIILIAIAIPALAIAIPDLLFTAYRFGYILFIGSDHLTNKPARGCGVSFYRNGSLNPWHIYYITLYLLIYVLPLILVVIFFILTKFKLQHRLQNDSAAVADDTDTKLLHMTLYLMVAFVFFWSAEYIFFLVYHFTVYGVNIGAFRRYQFTYILIQHFTLCKTIANPIIYAYFIPEIKESLVQVFTCGYIRQVRPQHPQGQSDMIKLTTAEA